MIPLVTAIEDLDAVLPDDIRIAWDQGTDSNLALTIENDRASIRFKVDSDTIVQRGEPYRRFLSCVAKVLSALDAESRESCIPDRRLSAGLR